MRLSTIKKYKKNKQQQQNTATTKNVNNKNKSLIFLCSYVEKNNIPLKKQRPLLREVKKEKLTFNRYNVARFSYSFHATDIHFIF